MLAQIEPPTLASLPYGATPSRESIVDSDYIMAYTSDTLPSGFPPTGCGCKVLWKLDGGNNSFFSGFGGRAWQCGSPRRIFLGENLWVHE